MREIYQIQATNEIVVSAELAGPKMIILHLQIFLQVKKGSCKIKD
jgi:hypothetical protein